MSPATGNAELPTVCAPCATSGATVTWAQPGSKSRYIVEGAEAFVKQALERETFNWRTFNIGPDNKVTFDQPSSSSVALNRIFQNDPSRIYGALKANGQVILINQNGVMFERGAKVDVNTLIASTLDISDKARESLDIAGVARTDLEPAFRNTSGGDAADVVVKRGASIAARENGRVILIGGKVENSGEISVSGRGGQALLAAEHDEVFLYVDDDPNVRGLAIALTQGGEVTNGGAILADRGNVTLAGLTVNQNGLIRSTTAVDANGTIRLQARDQSLDPFVLPGSGRFIPPAPVRGGAVNFGADSVTTVAPLVDNPATVIDSQPTFQSQVAVDAKDITLAGGAKIDVPAGKVTLTAKAFSDIESSVEGSITMNRGASIDVSGLDDIEVSVARNFPEQEVRRNELADSPAQRDGPLFGEVVRFDLRKPLPSIVNVDAAVSNIGRSVAERSTPGGEIVLQAADRIDIAQGALLDVSGGSLNVLGAFVASTKLIQEGRIIDISDASPSIRYDAVLGDNEFTHAKWGPETTEYFSSFGAAQSTAVSGFEQGYREGKDAGSLSIIAPQFSVNGTLLATTTRGRLQRLESGDSVGTSRPFDELPRGGQLALLSSTLEQNLTVGNNGFDFIERGFTDFSLALNEFVLGQDAIWNIPEGGSVAIRAADSVLIEGSVVAPGGTVELLVNPEADGIEKLQDEVGSITLGAGARIDLEGRWVVDDVLMTQRYASVPEIIDGGSFSADVVGNLAILGGAFVDVGGGGVSDLSGNIRAGDGGEVNLSAATFLLTPATVDLLDSSLAIVAGHFEGYTFPGAAAGSRFSLTAPGIDLGGVAEFAPAAGTVPIDAALLSDFGFHDFTFASNERVIRIGADTSIDVTAKNLVVPAIGSRSGSSAGFELPPTGTDIDEFTVAQLLDPSMRTPTSLTLDSHQVFTVTSGASAPNEALRVPATTRIAVDYGGSVAFSNDGSIIVGGEIAARGGEVTLGLSPVSDFGYLPELGIWFEPGSRIDVSGAVLPSTVDALGRVDSVVRIDGGSVDVNAGAGYIIGMPGSIIDVSGATGTVTTTVSGAGMGQPATRDIVVASNAGSVSLLSAAGIHFFSQLDGSAERTLGANGGSLTIALDGNLRPTNQVISAPSLEFPATVVDGVEELTVQLGAAQFRDEIRTAQALPDELFDVASFSLDNYVQGGFDELHLRSSPNLVQKDPSALALRGSDDPLMESVVELVGNGNIDVGRVLTLDAPVVQSDGGRLEINADYLKIGFDETNFVTSDTPVPTGGTDPAIKYFSAEPGTGAAVFTAEFIDFEGFTTFHGFGSGADATAPPLQFSSAGDVRFRGVRAPVDVALEPQGALITAADVLLEGRRIYASTLTDFVLANVAEGGAITFGKRGSDAVAAPLSAGSSITVRADTIVQGGRLYAPIGTIALEAAAEVRLAGDSLTSVTGLGAAILFGRIQVEDWVFPYNDAGGLTRVFEAAPDSVFGVPPEKRITLTADGRDVADQPIGTIDIEPGALIDVRGGGTLLATEFLPGPLGKTNLLDASLHNGSFALLPASGDVITPIDPLESAFEFGALGQIEIRDGGNSGLLPGTYAILPPRYALLPGAVLLTPVDVSAATSLIAANPTRTADGFPLVTGDVRELGQRGAELDTRYFQVENGRQLRNRAEYRELGADEFFSTRALDGDFSAPLLPRDSGALSISTNATLRLGGTIVEEINLAGIGSRVDIGVKQAVIGNSAADFVAAPGEVFLDARGLEALNADSILIGGIRSTTSEVSQIENVTADSINVLAGTSIMLPEILFAANDSITVESGASIRGVGRKSSGSARLELEGDGAMLLSSAGDLPEYTRIGASAGSTAFLSVGAGASLFGDGALIVDSSGGASLDGARVAVGALAGLHLGARRINLGNAPADSSALRLDSGQLATLAGGQSDDTRIETLRLVSATTIDFYAGAQLDSLNLSFDAAGFSNAGGVGSVRVAARNVQISNTAGNVDTGTTPASGELNIAASEGLTFGFTGMLDPAATDDGDFDIHGFDVVRLRAPELRGEENHRLEVNDGSLLVATDLITAASGTDLELLSAGRFELSRYTQGLAATPDRRQHLGARISLGGADVSIASSILAPGGLIDIEARTGDLLLREFSLLDAAGIDAIAGDPGTGNTPGGIVSIESLAGDVSLENNARIDVSAGAGQFHVSSGIVDVRASGGSLSLDPGSTLAAHATLPELGGSARFDIGDFAPGTTFSAFGKQLTDGGFTRENTLRQRLGDLLLAGSDRLEAREIRLVTDQGDLTIAGTLLADGFEAGSITAIAGGDLVINPTANLSARATGGFLSSDNPALYDDGFRGGSIALTSAGGTIDFVASASAQATLDVAGTVATAAGALAPDASGSVRLTAPRTGTHGAALGSTVAGGAFESGRIEAAINGAGTIDVVANKVYDASAASTVEAEAKLVTQTFSGSGIAGTTTRIMPGVEIRSSGDIASIHALGVTYASPSVFFPGGIFDETTVVPGVLTWRSAGDMTVTADLVDGKVLEFTYFSEIAGDSDTWTYQFVSGADLDSADPLAVIDGDGDFTLRPNVDIWTGTGDIVIRSGGDFIQQTGATIASIGRHEDLVNYQGAYSGSVFGWGRNASYPDGGGDIDIRIAGDIDIATSNQTVKNYTNYLGTIADTVGVNAPRAWNVNLGGIKQNVVSLAGGAIRIESGGDLNGGQFTMATIGRQEGDATLGAGGTFVDVVTDEVNELGGGPIEITSRGNISDVDITVIRGNARVRSFGSIGLNDAGAVSSNPRLFIGDAVVDLEAARGITLGTVVDPTTTVTGAANPKPTSIGSFDTDFLSMTRNSALFGVASAGDIVLTNQSVAESGVSTLFPSLINLYPGSLDLVAASGDLVIRRSMSLFPTANGSIRLIADGQLGAPSLENSVSQIKQFEGDPAALVTRDLQSFVGNSSALLGLDVPGLSPLHQFDIEPNLLSARNGDIRNLRFESAETVLITAGRDVTRVSAIAKHANAGDTSLISAGRDIVQATVRNPVTGGVTQAASTIYSFAGPGEFSFIAGRDIDLGTSSGIVTNGNENDPRLPGGAGSINLLAGITDTGGLSAFVAAYSDAYASALQNYLAQQVDHGRTVATGVTPAQQFASLDTKDQVRFAAEVLFDQLRQSGVAASTPDSGQFEDYSQGFTAIETLFPGMNYDGDVRTPLSTVQTREGGSIRVLAPGGIVDAGLTATEGVGGTGSFKSDNQLGFIVFREGDINAFVHDDFNVNSTRVFAQQGGDILIWSSTGDIDAGRGAKSAATIDVPAPSFDAFGNFLDKPPLQVVGSGIRNFAPSDIEPGTLYLFAPRGIIDAGDAGIGSAGNIVIGATEVIGADNIDIGGVSIGVPAGDTGGIAAGLTSVGDAAASATRATEQQQAQAAQQAAAGTESFDTASLSIIQVEVLGFGT